MSPDEENVRRHEVRLLETQMLSKIDQLQRDMGTIKIALNELLTRKEFEPYRLVIMGLIGGVLMAVLAGLMALVIGK
jgi:hypothetical protein